MLAKNLNLKKALTTGLLVVLGLTVFILLINQIDASLNPQIQELQKKEIVVSEQEKLFYESFIAQNYCEDRSLTKKQIQEVLVALRDAAPFRSLHMEDFSKRMRCFNQLFTAGDFALFEDLTKDHKKNQPATETLIAQSVDLSLKIASGGAALDYLRATMLLQYALMEAEKIQRRNKNYRLPYKKQVQEFLEIPPQTRLENIRDFEILLSEKMMTQMMTDPNVTWSNRVARTFFFLPNRALNHLYSYWNESIQQALLCQTSEGCPEMKRPALRFYNWAFNPFGQAYVALMAPDTAALARKLRDRTERMKEMFGAFQ